MRYKRAWEKATQATHQEVAHHAQQKLHETGRKDLKRKTATDRVDGRISSRCKDLRNISVSPCSKKKWSRGESNPRPVNVQDSVGNDLRDASNAGGAESGAVNPISTPNDPDLQKIINAWPMLPDAIRAAITTLTEAAQRDE